MSNSEESISYIMGGPLKDTHRTLKEVFECFEEDDPFKGLLSKNIIDGKIKGS